MHEDPHPEFGLAKVERALVSVFDKAGLEGLVSHLGKAGVHIIASGGTAAFIKGFGIPVDEVSDVTGFPEILSGRVKTLHPRIHGGLLANRADAEHRAEMASYGIQGIDLLVINLYPFESALQTDDFAETIENIDIGGPAMIRAAAKNHLSVCVVSDPEDYSRLVDELKRNDGKTTLEFRKEMAAAAFGRTAFYDAAISTWLTDRSGQECPRHRVLAGKLTRRLRYGENPHQSAALYSQGGLAEGLASARQLQGPEPGFNNIADADAALELVAEFDPADGFACVIVKHGNPCGVAVASSQLEAYTCSLACDPTSAFGGIVAFNARLAGTTAGEIARTFTEVVISPGVDAAAAKALTKKPGVRLFTCDLPDRVRFGLTCRHVRGGMLVQDRDTGSVRVERLASVTKRKPAPGEIDDMAFAWKVVKHAKSNAIVYARNRSTVGIGAGQSSRVDAARIASLKVAEAGHEDRVDVPKNQMVAASDAFFPFADGLEAVAGAGVTAVIQPGGSRNDAEVIGAADKLGIAMVFTGMRHFRH